VRAPHRAGLRRSRHPVRKQGSETDQESPGPSGPAPQSLIWHQLPPPLAERGSPTATRKPYGGNAFSEQFRKWCDAAGLPKRCKPHGLRKAACRRLAEAGCSANEIMAISGHATMKELVRYTKAADQARLARNAMTRTMVIPGHQNRTTS